MTQAGPNPQEPGSARRGPWQRSYSTPVRNRRDGTPSTISEVTRNKLERLKFRPKTPGPQDEPTPAREPNEPDAATGTEARGAEEKESTEKADWAKLPAVTPIPKQGRHWVPESSGRAEDDGREVSPNDRLMWAAMQDEREAAYPHLSSLARRKNGRKRARSSSPTSSPMGKTNSPVVNIKQLAQALKSPHPDPTLDLWDRYTLGGSGADAGRHNATGTGLNALFATGSPRPVGRNVGSTPQKESALRRSITSRGLHFNKRRKTDMQDETPTATGRGATSKYSLVTSLLDSVTSSMQDTQENENSSPLMDRGNLQQDVQGEPAGSPSPRKKTRSSLPSSPPCSRRSQSKHTEGETAHPVQETASPLGPINEFGDDDFDDDVFMAIDAQVGAATTSASSGLDDSTTGVQQSSDPGELAERPDSRKSPRNSPRKTPYLPQGTPCAKASSALASDDYGLDDDDIDDDTLMELADQVAPVKSPVPPSLDQGGKQAHTNTAHPLSTAGANPAPDDVLFDDDFGDDADWDAVELAATQAATSQPPKSQSAPRTSNVSGSIPRGSNPRVIQRYLIKVVTEGEYVDRNGTPRIEKMLALEADKTNMTRVALLRGDWYETEAHTNSWVHIIGDFDGNGRCIIDNDQNMLILHPDQLVSTTVVADAFSCVRRAVLQNRVKATTELGPPVVYGTMLHEIFQESLTAKRWDPPFLADVIRQVMEKHVEDLYTIKVGMEVAREHLESRMPELRKWAAAFVSAYPKPSALAEDRNSKKLNIAINKLLEIEEHVWSPMYGLKGNIDATVQVMVKDQNQRQTLTAPLEVKSGKNVTTTHTAQTALYNLLLSDRYDINITSGFLYYMQTSQTLRIPTIRRELRHMIMMRNQLAVYIREGSVQLPPMVKRQNLCGRCYAQTSCFIYHKLADDGTAETSGMGEKFDEVVQHLTPIHRDFFVKWEKLLTMEEKETQKFKRELWTMTSSARERLGRCFGDVVIDQVLEQAESSKINRFKYTFVKRAPAPGFSFVESQLTVGEPIVVSDEQGHFALALGFVTTIRKEQITVAVDRRLDNSRTRQPGFDEVNNQVFTGLMEVGVHQRTSSSSTGASPPIRYRIDKDEFSNGMATVRNNLIQVMADGVSGSQAIRRLVVDLEPPSFKATPTQYNIAGYNTLNIDQKHAIEKVMSAESYALVLGMPGTGKTTTISHIIRALTAQGKSVLLTSYTHSAVDNILLKLKTDNINILRLGAQAKVHPEVQQFVTLAAEPKTSFEEIKEAWHDTPVVATTCLSIKHQIFNERTFDYCIVDEASQITLPVCLGPILMARKFVLVGDHNQLPPLVQNEEARDGGLDVSLFKLLSETHPDSVVNLEHQYRMCEDIMTLSNTLIYEGRLRCGTEELRTRSLNVPNIGALRQRHYDSTTLSKSQPPHSICTGGNNCWLRRMLAPEARVRFLNTDTLSPRPWEEAKGNRIVNPAETRIVTQIVESLITAGVPASEIGVMTHYRSQLSHLKHALRYTGVEMHTADRFQGRDKGVVVLSLVRCNEAGNIGDLLKDWRRINVAFTRAKTKLLVVGSQRTLGANPEEMVGRFVDLMRKRRWVEDLPADALVSHFFEEALTQSWRSPRKSPLHKRSPLKAASQSGKSPGTTKRKLFAERRLDKENMKPKRAGMGEAMVLKKMRVGRDVLNELTDGMYRH